jgi:hypothetical protein
MRKIHILGLALFAVLAFSAVATSAAFAVSEFLVGGAPAIAEQPGESSGTLKLTDLTSFGEATVECTGILVGEFMGANDFLVLMVLNLNKELIELGLLALECEGSGLCEKAGALVWPEKLPWLAEVVLDAGTTFLIHLTEGEEGGMPAYASSCKTFLGQTEDECEGLVSGKLENMAEGLLAIFSLAEVEAEGEQSLCKFTNGKTGHLAGEGLLTSSAGAVTAS